MLELLTAFLAPAAAIMLALPFGMHFRGSSDDRQVRAVYLFHRSGEPVATVASDRVPPFAPEQLAPIIGTVRDFVETSVPASQGYDIMRMRFDEESLVAVRGTDVSVCAILRSRNTAGVRRDLIRFIRAFEGRHEGRLGTWENACRLAGEATDALSPLLGRLHRETNTIHRKEENLIRADAGIELSGTNDVRGNDTTEDRVVFVEVKGRLWALVDQCGCKASDCLETQAYASLAATDT